ncbi:MAG: Spy/CpxP family protein refolding chaperone [Caulobacter sp.]|nr:Spy/CpxP family protein refolding chaperone [Caulobacter sp.]
MNRIFRTTGLLASAAFVLAAGGSAIAGEPGKTADEPVVVSGSDIGRPMPLRRHWDPAARADHLRTLLQLRPDQEPALKAFLEATRPESPRFEGARGRDAAPARPLLTTPERLDRQARRMAEHQAAFARRAAATRAFYGQLNASQQKVFDTVGARHGGGRHLKMLRRGGPGGHPGGQMMRHGGEGGPGPGGMAWDGQEGEDFALLGDDMDIQIFMDGEDFEPSYED